jgi:hypothetical protein
MENTGWEKIAFPSDKEATEIGHVILRGEFDAVFTIAGSPRDAVLGTNQFGEFLFSPGAVRIAKNLLESYGAVKCAAPKEVELNILICNGRDSIPFGPA